MQKMKCIQGIRGIAIFLIVLWHLNSVFPNCLPAFGDRGVEFFFLISGFLIGLKYYDSENLSTVSFNNSTYVSFLIKELEGT